KSLYFTLSAHNYLASRKPEWIAAHNDAQSMEDFFHAGQDGTIWRKLDRQFHFDAILLCGDPSEFQPLLSYLTMSPDMTLVYLDHTSLIFMRSPAKPWTPDNLHELKEKFASYPKLDRANFLTKLATNLIAAGRGTLAKQTLDESLSLDSNSPDTWTQLAHYDAQTNNLSGALDEIDRALKLDPGNYYALTTRVRVLQFMKRYQDAMRASNDLLKTRPDDSMLLYQHVMVAHDAAKAGVSSYREEINTLRHLIDIVSAQKQPVSGFRIYLAQAYEMDGQATAALDEFQQALDEGSLSDEQEELIQKQMKSIEKQLSQTP
ncbi:MAG TPA: hypothetical protein VG733_03640, partial [Chthoniobacteraceae bacterium]|nr:hypothetical protein [Chthoniobacteraceae bacterium]